MPRRAFITVDTAALAHNLERVKHFAPRSKVMAIIKANAYGHGMLVAAKTLAQQADAFGVATIGEALQLRASKVDTPIVALEGFLTSQELIEASEYQIHLFIHHLFQIEILEKTALPRPVSVWIKVDTGMNRLGISPEEVLQAIERLSGIAHIKAILGLATHFARADEVEVEQTKTQLSLFQKLTTIAPPIPLPKTGGEGNFSLFKKLEKAHTLANSAGILAWPTAHFDWVRPGIMLYGVSPFSNRTPDQFDLKPVMSFQSTLIAIKSVKAGENIGYGATWTCKENTRIGVVAVGYADGYPRSAINGTPVFIKGQRVPLVGRVSMDMITVDLNQCPDAQVGDAVELWGKHLPIHEVADRASTIAYELLCRMSHAPRGTL